MHTSYSSLTDTLKAEISAALSPGAVVTHHEQYRTYTKDASKLQYEPDLIVCAQCVEDIQRLLELSNTHHFPVIPRGAGSGLAGGCLADVGGVVLSTERLNRILKVDSVNNVIQVQSGVISHAVKQAAEECGLYYPPDPAGMELSTIGGNAATDAGGPACLKYGTTRDYILGLEAVLPSGELIQTGVQTKKGVVGYDLTNLLIGSEGTLGIITSLYLKLIPKPQAVAGLMCVFNDMTTAMQSVTRIMSSGYLPCAIEFLDYRCVELVGEMLPFDLPEGEPSILIIEVDGGANLIQEELTAIRRLLEREGATAVVQAQNEQQRQEIWNVRRQVSLRIHDYANVYLPEDVAVPIAAIAQLISLLPQYEQQFGVEIFAFGHAGDGNIHLSVTAQNENQQERAEAAVEALLQKAIDMQGTISGEHGIGIAKRDYIAMELSEKSLKLQKNIKKLFDPNNILNPGKVFP